MIVPKPEKRFPAITVVTVAIHFVPVPKVFATTAWNLGTDKLIVEPLALNGGRHVSVVSIRAISLGLALIFGDSITLTRALPIATPKIKENGPSMKSSRT